VDCLLGPTVCAKVNLLEQADPSRPRVFEWIAKCLILITCLIVLIRSLSLLEACNTYVFYYDSLQRAAGQRPFVSVI